jgi:zinc protease
MSARTFRLALLLLGSACALLCAACAAKRPVVAEPTGAVPTPLEASRIVALPTSSPVIELRVAFFAGSVDDPRGREGLTYVTATSMAEGGAGSHSFAERERLLFPMAAEIGAQVERELVVFHGRVHRDHFSAFYPLFRDVLLDPRFELADVQRVKERTLSALTQDLRGADDESLGKEVLQAMLFEGHPYGRPAIGTETGLLAISVDEVRRHRAQVLCGARVQVTLSGALPEGAVDLLRADLGALPHAECAPQAQPAPRPELDGRRLWIVDKPEAQAVAISMGLPIEVTRAHPDYAALTLAAAYLGQHRTFAGRLMQKMRGERGLNYGDYAYAEHFAQAGYTRFPAPNVARRHQYFSIWVRPVPRDKAQFALRMAVRELEAFVKDGMTDEDFVRIRDFTERYFALFAQTEQQRLGNLLDQRFYGLDEPYLDGLRARIAKLTRDEVHAAVQRHLDPARLQIALVAPNASELLDAIASDAPSPIQYASEKPQSILDEDALIARHPVALPRERAKLLKASTVFR